MSGAKFFVWGGERWREVSPSGRVAGWGRARFVAAAGGRLTRCRRSAVLRGLSALATGRPTTVHDGPPLLPIRLDEGKKCPEEESSPPRHGRCRRCQYLSLPAAAGVNEPMGAHTHTHTHAHAHARAPALLSAPTLSTDEIFNRLLKSTVTAGTQCGPMVDACVQACSAEDQGQPDKNHNCKTVLKPIQPKIVEVKSLKDTASSKRKHAEQTQRGRASAVDTDGEICKELVIDEEDVALLRRFVELHDQTLFPVDLLRFDEDDDYKRRVFFRFNPIVNIARCRRVDRMIYERRSRTRETSWLSLKDFASSLGLQSVDEEASTVNGRYRTRNKTLMKRKDAEHRDSPAINDTDKENAGEPRSTPKLVKNSNGVLSKSEKRQPMTREVNGKVQNGRISHRPMRTAVLTSGDHDECDKKQLKKTVASPTKRTVKQAAESKQSGDAGGVSGGGGGVNGGGGGVSGGGGGGVSGGREYSTLEDAAIVRWVCGEGRARLVNGNRLWRELQPLHEQHTGHFRSWHSLRNRYLRSLLPRLGVHVSAADAARLRAAAATGELKSRKSRRNSIFKEVRVPGAWSRRKRTPLRRSTSPPRTPSRAGSPLCRYSTTSSESRLSSSDSKASLRTHAHAHPRTGLQPTDKGEATRALRSSKVTPAQRPERPVAGTSPRRAGTPTYSEVTRRFATRSAHSSSSPRAAHSPRTSRSRTRRLYNPNVLV